MTVNNDVATLISQVSGADASSLSGLASTVDGQEAAELETVSGKIEALGSQMIAGSTVYYIQSEGKIYKVKATEDSTELDKKNYLIQFQVENE